MRDRCCEKCGQPLPQQPRKDPPLPALDRPYPITIHDLADKASAEIEVVTYGSSVPVYLLKGQPHD